MHRSTVEFPTFYLLKQTPLLRQFQHEEIQLSAQKKRGDESRAQWGS